MKELLSKIQALKESIDALHPLDATTLGRIEQKFRLDWNYHSNAIEGNSLNFGETKSFLLHGITAAGKPLKDHLDLRGHNEAILALQDIIKEERPITENFIRELHQVILVEDSYNTAVSPEGIPTRKKVKVGEYKLSNNHVETATGEIFYFATAEETPAKMHDLIQWLRAHKEQENPVVLAGLFHYKFITIHPFDDGNGRLARILMNFILMRAGFPPIVIKTREKEAYFRALRQADGGNVEAFVQYVAEQLVASLELYLKGARGESIEELDDVEKAFELFRMELEGKEELVYLREANRTKLIKEEVIPCLALIFDKLKRINDLFVEWSATVCIIDVPKINPKTGFKEYDEITFSNVKELSKSLLENELGINVERYVLSINWKLFSKKLGDKKIKGYKVKFALGFPLDKEFWYIDVILEENILMFYGKPNQEKAKEFANKILKDFMTFVKS
jgi:Fic family protein